MKVSLLSNETNSQDPLAIHSRIFVGNLNTFQCSKSDVEQIFQRYGHLTAISMHKGYAFVQFSNPVEAKNAVDGEDGRLVLNQNIDVNLVSQPKVHKQHQQVTAKHVFQVSSGGDKGLRHQIHTSPSTPTANNLATSRFQHLMVNGAATAVGGGAGAVIQPKLSGSIHKRRKRRRHQLNRIRSEFLLDGGSSIGVRLSGMAGNGQLTTLMANQHSQYAGISPTLSSSSSSSSSTSSLESSGSASSALSSSQQVPTEFTNYRANQVHHNQWYPGWFASGLNINNNYLISAPVYDNPNEVIDDSPTPPQPPQQQQHHHHQQPQQQLCLEEDSQEVVLYDGNNNPLSSWEEFILTTNKSSPVPSDILICGNCRELFNCLEHLLEHRRTTCQLRVFCECRHGGSSATSNPSSSSSSSNNNDDTLQPENTILFCRMCRKQFSHSLALLQHVQHVHQIKIFETEPDYTPVTDLATHEEHCSSEVSTTASPETSSVVVPTVQLD